MVVAESITSFVPRDAFGHWLSGFTDGEGCFYLGITNRGKYQFALARFDIQLRVDDKEILESIRDFWGVGVICEHRQRGPSKTKAKLTVSRAADLVRVVIPHFESHPLRAKKRRDFAIWREGVELYYSIQRRPVCPVSCPGKFGGTRPRWTPAEMEQFRSLSSLLRDQRQFQSPELCLPPPVQGDESQALLFA